MDRAKKILWVILILFIAMQFIRPARNSSNAIQQTDMIRGYNTPANVAGVLKTSCYDCHSNHTRYPWYANVQPIGWILAKHIKDGKQDLNFNEFTTYSKRRQLSKLKSIQNSIKDGSMPLSSYTMLHSEAKLSKGAKVTIIEWTTRVIDSLLSQ